MEKKKLFMPLTSTTRGRCRYIYTRAKSNAVTVSFTEGKLEATFCFSSELTAI